MKADKQAKIDRRNEKRGVYKTYKDIVDEEHKDVPNGEPEPEKVESFPGEFSDNPSYRQKPKPGFTIPPKGAFEDPAA